MIVGNPNTFATGAATELFIPEGMSQTVANLFKTETAQVGTVDTALNLINQRTTGALQK